MPLRTRSLTSESVTEGHPDKVADYISDSILDAYLEAAEEKDRRLVRLACEVDDFSHELLELRPERTVRLKLLG